MNFSRFIALLCAVCFSGTALAQQTPRERIVEMIQQGEGLPDTAPGDEDLPMQTGVIDSAPSMKIEPLPQSPLPPAPPELPETNSQLPDENVAPKVKITVFDEMLSERQNATKTAAPFYVSAAEYWDIRGADKGAQAVLEYSVEVETMGREIPLRARKITLAIGDDYAAITSGQTTKIYDFRLERLLSLAPYYGADGAKTDKLQFDNVSLYAKVYRNISAVRGATQGGDGKKVQIGQNKFIDKFWIESAMSWAANLPETPLVIDEQTDSLSIMRNASEVFTAEFSDESYSSAAMKDSFLVFAHHEMSIHPLIMKRLAQYDSPIKYMEVMAYGPNTPDGQKQIWSLTDQREMTTGFPLPVDALSVTQKQPISPLTFVINEAAHGRALGGKKTAEELQAEFEDKVESADEAQAWLIAQRYLAHTGIDCKARAKNSVCAGISALEGPQDGERAENMQRYYMAATLAKTKTTEDRVELIKTVQPNLEDQSAPAFIFRLAAMARAKLTKAQAADAALSNMSAEALLQMSLAKDPYDPNTYMGLAQVLAAKGKFEQSWDIYDAMRAEFPNRADLSLKINRAEKNLRTTAPGYFLIK